MTNSLIPVSIHRQTLSKRLALIVGVICLLGFIVDILVIGLPPNPLAPQWRLNFLQQVAERSLLLFIGSTLLLFSLLDASLKVLQKLSASYLIIGILVGLSSLIVIKDNFVLKSQALSNINIQATELRTQIVKGQENSALNEQIDADAFTAALLSVDSQADVLRKNIQTGAMKTLISSAGNLFLVGVGLVGVGRLGLLKSLSGKRKR